MDLTAPLLALGALTGLMIGCVGIGGVVLVPAMTVGIGIPLGNAIAAALMGYVFTGISGTLIFGRSGSIDRRLALDRATARRPGLCSEHGQASR